METTAVQWFALYVMSYITGVDERDGQTFVVVSMTIGIIAFSVDFFIFLIAQVNAAKNIREHVWQ